MASIRKRGERWHVQIRRQGTSSISKSFTTKTDAKAWGLQTEALVESCGYQKAAHNLKTLECLLVEYRDDRLRLVSPSSLKPNKRESLACDNPSFCWYSLNVSGLINIS